MFRSKWRLKIGATLAAAAVAVFGLASAASASPVPVVPGDTFSQLVQTHCHTSNWESVAFPGRNKNLIYAGETIDITCPGSSASKPASTSNTGSTPPPAPRAQGNWASPVPGHCPSTNTRYGGGAYWAGRPYGHHEGQDFPAPSGTPIHSISPGTVVHAAMSGSAGNQIQIRYGNLLVKYNHLSSFAVHVGNQVSAGQIIGRVGSTGHATGPHLHLETWVNGGLTNPLNFLRDHGINARC